MDSAPAPAPGPAPAACRPCVSCGESKAVDRKDLCKPCRKAETKKFKASKEGHFRNQVRLLRKMHDGRRRVLLTPRDLTDLWDAQSGRCAITGMDMTHSAADSDAGRCATVDLIDAKGDAVKENARLVCRRVKRMKGNEDVETFRALCAAVASGASRLYDLSDPSGPSPSDAARPDSVERDPGVGVGVVTMAVTSGRWADAQDDDRPV